ncbi:hypothetical protein [Bradyrhizobium elkanii]|uniref:hypothetical protein n=1 Tax=Bradyrhizobium elkanii TaxID=29448 RepID=UPI002168EDC5|nr:hypothetical protein [Bradyrhizobium elkanii]MCS3689081.1 hypothetical protein [Bradyrhizobium elkanii]
MKHILIALAVLCTVIVGITAANAKEPADMAGIGTASCAEFAQDYYHNPAVAETAYTDWLLGFLTGANITASALNKPERNIGAWSIRDIKSNMRDYCNDHPLASYIEAAIELFKQLPVMPKADS